MRTRRQYANQLDCVFYDENRGLILYTNPGMQHGALGYDFQLYKDHCTELLDSLVIHLEHTLKNLSKGIALWSKVEKNHPANQLLNLISFFKADARVGYGRASLPPNAIQIDEPDTPKQLALLLSQTTNCSEETAWKVIQLVNASKGSHFSSDIASITNPEQTALLPGIQQLQSFDQLDRSLKHSLSMIEAQINLHRNTKPSL